MKFDEWVLPIETKYFFLFLTDVVRKWRIFDGKKAD